MADEKVGHGLVNELVALTKKASDDSYKTWRKKVLTADFFKDLKDSAEKGLNFIMVKYEVFKDEVHWERWTREHGFNYEHGTELNQFKVWWPVQ